MSLLVGRDVRHVAPPSSLVLRRLQAMAGTPAMTKARPVDDRAGSSLAGRSERPAATLLLRRRCLACPRSPGPRRCRASPDHATGRRNPAPGLGRSCSRRPRCASARSGLAAEPRASRAFGAASGVCVRRGRLRCRSWAYSGAVRRRAGDVPAAAIKARVNSVRCMTSLPPLCWDIRRETPRAARRSAARLHFRPHLISAVLAWRPSKGKRPKRKRQCTTTSSWAAARPARSWPIGCRRAAPTRCWCARPARTRRPARSRRRSSTPIPARPTSIRASTGPSSRSTPRSSSHNNPHENRPPLRKYEQARVLGGGSSINGQMANRGAPTDYDEWVKRGAEGWGWDNVLPFFKKVERDLDFDERVARQGRPHSRAPHPGRALDRPRHGGRRGLQAGRHDVPARPERRVRRRLLPGHAFQRRRSSACRRRWAISTPRRASGPTSPSRPTRR